MKHLSILFFSFILSSQAFAISAPFQLNISGDNFTINKTLNLKDVEDGKTEINFDFQDKQGEKYNFDLKYKKLPQNRSYPTNLDITIKDESGMKLGYLFWANNGVKALQKIGTFGIVLNIKDKPVDFKFVFDENKNGTLKIADLEQERFVQDTLISKFGFQMIRPVIVPKVSETLRSQTYALDAHPYEVNYTLKDIDGKGVEFQYNFIKKNANNKQLLERIYYHADSLETLRSGMFAGKYFDKEVESVKLVFYPTMGQTTPPVND